MEPELRRGIESLQLGLKVYWLPGCSSCVKVKEHLNNLNVPFESVNVASDPRSMDDLLQLGVRSVPVVTRGSAYVFAQSLEAVTAFVGKAKTDRVVQKPAFYLEKWLFLLAVGRSYLDAVPQEVLERDVIKERKRAIGELVYHVYQIPKAFVHCMRHNDPDWLFLSSGPAEMDIALTKPRLRQYAQEATEQLTNYWNGGQTDFKIQPMTLDKGLKTSMELLDRSSWHSAQHLRQIVSALEREGVALTPAWDAGFYSGLNVPEQLWT